MIVDKRFQLTVLISSICIIIIHALPGAHHDLEFNFTGNHFQQRIDIINLPGHRLAPLLLPVRIWRQ